MPKMRVAMALSILLCAAPALAQSFRIVEHPQATPSTNGIRSTQFTTIDGNTAAGHFFNVSTGAKGNFFYDLTTGAITPFNQPGEIQGMAGNNIVGYQLDTGSTGTVHAFLYNGSTYINFDYPGATHTFAQDIDDAGAIGGYYYTTTSRENTGFLRSPGGVFTPVRYPASLDTKVYGIGNGVVVGEYTSPESSFPHGFVFNGITYQSVDYPGSTATQLFDIQDGLILGTWANRDTIESGQFLYNGSTFTDIHLDTPAGSVPFLRKFDGNQAAGTLYGPTGAAQGLIATIPEPAAALNLLWLGFLTTRSMRRLWSSSPSRFPRHTENQYPPRIHTRSDR
jgi:hypothetical protein